MLLAAAAVWTAAAGAAAAGAAAAVRTAAFRCLLLAHHCCVCGVARLSLIIISGSIKRSLDSTTAVYKKNTSFE